VVGGRVPRVYFLDISLSVLLLSEQSSRNHLSSIVHWPEPALIGIKLPGT